MARQIYLHIDVQMTPMFNRLEDDRRQCQPAPVGTIRGLKMDVTLLSKALMMAR